MIVHMQSGYLKESDGALSMKPAELTANINRIADTLRRLRWTIVHVLQTFNRLDATEYCIEELLSGLDRRIRAATGDNAPVCPFEQGDFIVGGKMFSGFDARGSLSDLLSQNGTSRVAVCGVKTGTCVLDTAEDAHRREGYPTFVFADCTAEDNQMDHRGSLEEIGQMGITVANAFQAI